MPRLIIIDDDQMFGELLSEIAKQVDFDVDVVTDFPSFNAIYPKYNYDILSLDISMPDTDGFEMINALAEIECKAKIIIVSGHDETLMYSAEEYAKAKGLNIIAVMRKPIEVEEFENVLQAFA